MKDLLKDVTEEKGELTVERAKAALAKNSPHNRNPSKERVAAYARDILEGRWGFDGKPIAFDKNGVMIDGMHRCMAVIEAGKSIPVLFMYGLEPEAINIMDVTGKNRTTADVLKINGFGNSHNLATALTTYIAFQDGDILRRQKISATLLLETAEKHPGLAECCDRIHGRGMILRRMMSMGALGALYYVFRQDNRSLADEMIEGLVEGFSDKTRAFNVMRNALLNIPLHLEAQQKRTRQMYALISGWNAEVAGKKISKIVYLSGSRLPKVMKVAA